MSTTVQLMCRLAGAFDDETIAADEGLQSDLYKQAAFPGDAPNGSRTYSRDLLSKDAISYPAATPTTEQHFWDLAGQAMADWGLDRAGWMLLRERQFKGHRWKNGGWQPTSSLAKAYLYGIARVNPGTYYAESMWVEGAAAIQADFWVVVQVDELVGSPGGGVL